MIIYYNILYIIYQYTDIIVNHFELVILGA